MSFLKPGYTQKGTICKDCVKSWKKHKTFCNRPQHHKLRKLQEKKPISPQKKENILNESILVKYSQDYNYIELITAVCLLVPDNKTREDIISHSDKITCYNTTSYLLNLERRTDKVINNYIAFVNSIRHHFQNIEEVIVIGKSYSKYPDLQVINQGLDLNTCKSDLMLRDNQNRWLGISVKSNEKCYLTKYSLENLLPRGNELQQIKQRFLMDEGYPTFNKEEQKEVNELFHYKPHRVNPYWNSVIETIETHKIDLTKFFLDSLCSSFTPYPVYQIDGISMVDLNRNLRPYLNTLNLQLKLDNTPKTSSELVYYLENSEKKYYQVDIGWKDNVYQSPQIRIQLV